MTFRSSRNLVAALALLGGLTSFGTAVHAEHWGALAAGIEEESDGSSHVSVGSALNHESRAAAQRAALASCRSTGNSACRVISTFNGCGYITLSTDGSRPAAWGSGPTAQDAYDECYKRIRSGNCKRPIGGCNEED